MRLKFDPICSKQILHHPFTLQKPTSSFPYSHSLTKCTQKDQSSLSKFAVSGTTSMNLLKSVASVNRPMSVGVVYSNMRKVSGVNIDGFSTHNDNFSQNTHHHQIAQIHDKPNNSLLRSKLEFLDPSMLGIKPEPPKWPEREELMRASIERRANSVDLPLSLRMIKKKQKLKEGYGDSGDSIKRAHSSMVFIILEIQRYALKTRESISADNFEGIITHIHREMNASFAWLFKQIFPQSPNLMICLMTLLADFSVYSLAMENSRNQQEFDTSAMNSNACNNCRGGERYLGGESNLIQNDLTPCPLNEGKKGEEKVLVEGIRMQVEPRGIIADHDMVKSSHNSVELEQDNYVEYQRADLQYQMNLSHDPSNPLLLCNYAQFLHLVVHDYDRAEECFKRAVQVKPADAEALNRYANFLWVVRNNLSGAEEKYIDAIGAESENQYYASTYANFLWNCGGEETCFPI